jgi:hypothetical protein
VHGINNVQCLVESLHSRLPEDDWSRSF